jgi:hypothetical protein
MAHLTDAKTTDNPPNLSGFCMQGRCTECKRRRIAACEHSCHDEPTLRVVPS